MIIENNYAICNIVKWVDLYPKLANSLKDFTSIIFSLNEYMLVYESVENTYKLMALHGKTISSNSVSNRISR